MYNKLYLIVRSDLSPEQQAIQTGHVAVEWASKYGYLYPHPTFVLLEAKNKLHLIKLMIQMILIGMTYVPFYESDNNEGITAIAMHYYGHSDKKFFQKQLELLKFRLK